MVKRVYERIQIVAKANQRTSVQHRLRSGYSNAVGVFFYIPAQSYGDSTNNIYCNLRIASQEVIADGAALDLFRWQPGISRSEAMWEFRDANVPAATNLLECEIDNQTQREYTINLYVLLENREA